MKIRSAIKGLSSLGLTLAMAISLPVNAAALSMWNANDWIMIDDDDGVQANGYLNPGYGGQAFDAEYLYYKFDKDTQVLSIGVQTGFDLSDGHQVSGGLDYYAGDLALSFNGQGYDYAIDFGLLTKDFWGRDNVGLGSGNQDDAGLYAVTEWNNDIIYSEASPFAMDEGSFLEKIATDSGSEGDSYYRTAEVDLSSLGFDVFKFGAHWTMSCGNDVVEGSANVPEPNPGLLLLGGLMALIGGRKLKSSAKA